MQVIDKFRNKILHGDCLTIQKQLPAKSIQCIVTSPPYLKKRKYMEGNAKEIGREHDPIVFVEQLCRVFDESKRILRDDGVLFVNIGDTNWTAAAHKTLKPTDLCLVPERFVIAMQDRGWYVHNDIIWNKKNPSPFPAFKKCKPSHEYIFFFTKTKDYFFDYIAIREPAKIQTVKSDIKFGGKKYTEKVGGTYSGNTYIPNGYALKKDVWTFSTASSQEAHCAVFPEELPKTAILCGTSEKGSCPVCGNPYIRIIEKGEKLKEWAKYCGSNDEFDYEGKAVKEYEKHGAQNASDIKRRTLKGMVEKKTVGWEPTCDCKKQQRLDQEDNNKRISPCVVLDPFMGIGTTATVAKALGRDYIGIELNDEYINIAERRLVLQQEEINRKANKKPRFENIDMKGK